MTTLSYVNPDINDDCIIVCAPPPAPNVASPLDVSKLSYEQYVSIMLDAPSIYRPSVLVRCIYAAFNVVVIAFTPRFTHAASRVATSTADDDWIGDAKPIRVSSNSTARGATR